MNRILLLIIFLTVPFVVFPQSKKDLENKRKKTQKEIQITNDLLKKTQRDKKLTLNQLNIINKQIRARQELIESILKEVAILNERISENREIILMMSEDLEKLKKDYETMIKFAWRNRSHYDKMMYVLSSDDFSQAYRRMKYISQYNEYRRKQSEVILAVTIVMQSKIEGLEEKKRAKESLLYEEKIETKQLDDNKKEQVKMVDNLQKKESELKKQLETQKKADANLKKAIADLIAEEIRKAEERRKAEVAKANKENKTVSPKNKQNIYDLTPEEQVISDNFSSNLGKLPWPTERGVVTGSYGEHEHPVLKGVIVKNDGIYISTTKGSIARSIFDGVVTSIVTIPGKHKVVIIRHGNFLSVYSNLSEVSVKMNEKVKSKQKIGMIYTDSEDDDKTIIEIQIWNGTEKQNPEKWLTKKI